jgi:hypothetical protein
MFQFPPFAAMHLCIQCMLMGHDAHRVSPFGYLRINVRFQLPVAFRR